MGKLYALVLDDDADNLDVLCKMLSDQAITYVGLQDPTQLEEALASMDHINLVFLDLEMPKVNGYEVLHVLREYVGPSVPIVAYTVHTNEINTARQMGFDSFIAKPLSSERFPDQLSRILSGKMVWEAY
jgi:CheY-like chemotaxis protein